MAFGAIGLATLVVCAIGAVNHHLLGSTPVLGISAAIIGSMALSMTAALVAGTRKGWLDDPVVRRHSRREIPGLAMPKPYDAVIALAAGLLAAAALWASVADRAGRA